MLIHIGNCLVHETTKELDYYFDKSQSHSWIGPTVKIKSIDFKLEANIGAMSYSKESPLTASVGFSIVAIISDENERIIEKRMTPKQFKDRFNKKAYQHGSYLIGWSEGENKIVLNEVGESFMKGLAVNSAY